MTVREAAQFISDLTTIVVLGCLYVVTLAVGALYYEMKEFVNYPTLLRSP
ncbi:hypothetical protein HZS55_06285 [Halosimplex rubrum]|uniref:Uncharacterized protein n=1 Tax=Halosimplex rubrum TaxID=869889 RepID=A0A7D5P3X6_9EURY|nr:hypothetical protein [Halosimplex rubrum]QLH76925.1 hypothetical protein HZS55_06285 [Halosimplex rubrum]